MRGEERKGVVRVSLFLALLPGSCWDEIEEFVGFEAPLGLFEMGFVV